MRTINLNAQIKVYEHREELPAELADLLKQADEAARNAYCPYSHFQVGAALQLVDGKVFKGSNQENAAFPSGLCAERTALYYAVANHPNTAIRRLAVVAVNPANPLTEPIVPCGNCRQSLLEYEHKFGQNIEIIMAAEQGPIYVANSVADLLPCSFTNDYL